MKTRQDILRVFLPNRSSAVRDSGRHRIQDMRVGTYLFGLDYMTVK